jgi:hypothetical protein
VWVWGRGRGWGKGEWEGGVGWRERAWVTVARGIPGSPFSGAPITSRPKGVPVRSGYVRLIPLSGSGVPFVPGVTARKRRLKVENECGKALEIEAIAIPTSASQHLMRRS